MEQILANSLWLIPLVIAWSLPWKGVALWRAAKRGERWWFIVLLLVNTLAVLEILYIFIFSRRSQSSVVAGPQA